MKDKLSDFFCLIMLPLIFLFGFELYLLRIAKFKNISKGNSECRIYDNEKGYSFYKKNCRISFKHWENEKAVNYIFNEYGRRDGNNPKKEKSSGKIAIVGGSFPLGAMVDINDNYNYWAFNPNRDKRFIVHNYAAALEGIDNTINKLVDKKFTDYDFIIYGISPNYFFKYLENNKSLINSKEKESVLNKLFNKTKSFLNSTAISRLILKKTMNNNDIYYKSYLMRKPYSNYLEPNLDEKWNEALEKFENKLISLPIEIKQKLKIIYIPQRVEIVSYKLGSNKNYLSEIIKKICLKHGIDFMHPNIKNLASLKNSHFTIDGHLTKEGHHSIGNDLYKWSLNW